MQKSSFPLSRQTATLIGACLLVLAAAWAVLRGNPSPLALPSRSDLGNTAETSGLAFLAPQSQCGILHNGSVLADRLAAVAAAQSSGTAQMSLRQRLQAQAQLAAAARPRQMPFLFDTASMPTNDTVCTYCREDDPGFQYGLCCGVCVFEHRRCDELYPGEEKTAKSVLPHYPPKLYPFDAFTPCELFQRLRGRTLWFMGDSQSWHFYYSAECFLREFAPHLRRSKLTTDATLRLALRPVTWPVPVWPICLELAEATRVCALRVDSADDMTKTVLPTLRSLRGEELKNDIMVYNIGLHYGPTTAQYHDHLALLAQYREANTAWLPRMVWMDTPVQHFSTHDGSWAGAAKPFVCRPLKVEGNAVVAAGGRYQMAAAEFVQRLGDGWLRTWNASIPLWDTHKPGECTHWASPGAYHVWLFLLNRELARAGLGSEVHVLGTPPAT